MKSKFLYFIAVIPFLLLACNSSKKKKAERASLSESKKELSEGFHLMKNNCFSCHSPNAGIQNKVAPSMAAIKEHYAEEGISYKEFAYNISAFLNNPSEQNSKMPEAIKAYNLMPKMSFTDEQISKISNYLYHSDIENPDWFTKQYHKEMNKPIKSNALSPLEQGQQIAMQTKGILGKNLLGAIKQKGTLGALSFCSIKAIPITDSMSIALNATVKRVSDKNRNPNNVANSDELKVIATMQLAIANGNKVKPQLISSDNKHVGYYPIVTNQMCMQCHGTINSDIKPEVLSKIKTLYPNDKAIAYKENELRGIWVIEMAKE